MKRRMLINLKFFFNLTIEIKELNLKYKRILEERNRLIQNNDKDLTKSEINLIAQSKNNNSLEMN